ncbi:MAG: SGNH/GDSL hydrolase family protein [Pseudomonadota bacterium]
MSQSSDPESERPSLGSSLLLGLFSLIFCLAIAEAAVRLTGLPAAQIEWWKMNVRAASEVRETTDVYAFTFSTDTRGLRLGPTVTPNSADPFRIAFIGDSFVFGLGVDDAQTVPALVQERLKERLNGRSVEILNFGIPGIGPYQYWNIAHNYVPGTEPDLVVIGLLHYNDLIGNNPIAFRSEEVIDQSIQSWKATIEGPQEDPDPQWLKDSFLWHSALIRFVSRRLLAITDSVDWRTHGAVWPGPSGNLAWNETEDCPEKAKSIAICSRPIGEWQTQYQRQAVTMLEERGELEKACRCEINPWLMDAYVSGAGQMFLAAFADPQRNDVVQSEMDLQLAALEEAVATLRRREIPVAISVFTSGFYVEPHLFLDIILGGGSKDELRRSREMHRRIAARCDRSEWICFDPVERLHREAAPEGTFENTLYIQNDGHMTARGNELYADELANFLAPLVGRIADGTKTTD